MLPVSRRSFLLSASSAALDWRPLFVSEIGAWDHPDAEVENIERSRVLHAAQFYLTQSPETITSAKASRSDGGFHDYFSEGDYWWPDPKNPDGPYIRRDGESNPANFTAHRELLIRLSIQMPALTAAWLLTKKRVFADHAVAHLRAWFVYPATRMPMPAYGFYARWSRKERGKTARHLNATLYLGTELLSQSARLSR